ncbi:probable E3 ubiquitin-protein ligase RHG1A isoform X1 [Vigna unguiculata]|nr:probable E3 ubiquitin-protein ligase RHG1A isoform X1 [Vigna unguiculata]
MDEYSGRRGVDGVAVPRKGMNHVFRDTANTRERTGQVCSKLGCSSRANIPKVAQARSSEKGKSVRPVFQSSSSSKDEIGSSSRSTSNPAKRTTEPQKVFPSQFEADSPESSSVQDEPESSELIPPSEEIQRGAKSRGPSSESSNARLMEVGSSSTVSNTRSQRNLNQRPGLRGQEIKSTGPVIHAVSSRYGLRNIRCNTISYVIPSSCSSSDSSHNRRKDTTKKRDGEGESSSTVRGKNVIGSSSEGRSSGSRNGISISDSRRTRNTFSHRNTSLAPVRTQRSLSGHVRARISSQGNENPLATSEFPHFGDVNPHGISCQISMETPLTCSSSCDSPGNSSEDLPLSPPAEDDITDSLNGDSFWHYNMSSIEGVLLALERIEQGGELTREQITDIYENGLNFYDHHRDMRLDIDNMSYEELLALEERMGTVSTALSEEALAESLKRSIYQSPPTYDTDENCNQDKDDIKCCICQEEYVIGDEVGDLPCNHRFHVDCIQEWMGLKNWCPICKLSAALSNNSSSSH